MSLSPVGLRAFRKSIGQSRREFAPRLFISEATLERWERGQGGPGKIHLLILHRMREHLGAGHSLTRFQYDRDVDVPAELLHDERRLIIDTLKGQSVVLLEERGPDARSDWMLRFELGWAAGDRFDLSLVCEGSDNLLRPAIDFILKATVKSVDTRQAAGTVQEICFSHCVSWKMTAKGKCTALNLSQRIFKTGCDSETVRHVMANILACWSRVRKALFREEQPTPRRRHPRTKTSPCRPPRRTPSGSPG